MSNHPNHINKKRKKQRRDYLAELRKAHDPNGRGFVTFGPAKDQQREEIPAVNLRIDKLGKRDEFFELRNLDADSPDRMAPLREVVKRYILSVLERVDADIPRAAEILGMSKVGLVQKLKTYERKRPK